MHSKKKKKIQREKMLAKVIELFPSKDGIIRLTKLRISKGILLRPVQRIYPLEITQEFE